MSAWEEIGPECFRRRYARYDLNVGVVRGADGLVVFDTRGSPTQGRELVEELATFARPVRHVVNSHWHFDHLFGNQCFMNAADPPTLWGHPDLRAMCERQFDELLAVSYAYEPELAAELDDFVLTVPDHDVADRVLVDLGDRGVVLVHYGRGHTNHDVVMRVPDAGVVFAGDLLEESAPPVYGPDSFPLAWAATVDALVAAGPDNAVVVPGHGDVMSAGDAAEQAAAIGSVASTMRELAGAGVAVGDALAAGEWPFPEATLTDAVARGFAELAAGRAVKLKKSPFGLEYKWIVAIVFVCGMFMDIMDTTIVNVALPTLQREFNTSTAAIEWVVLAYLLSLAVWIPASGWIGDRFGTKKTFLFALAMFTVASALCGQAHSLGELIGFRVLQGVGGGMLTPVGTAMLFRAFPPVERAKASTVLIIPTVLAPAMGPVVGGWLVTDVSWRWIFYVNLPVGVFGFVIGALFLREHREGTAGRFDLPGFVLSGGALALVLYALSQGPEKGWSSPIVLVTGVIGVVMFALLVFVETHVPEPMLALRLYKERMFRNANIVLTLTYGSFAGVLFILPLFLQELRGLSALQSGLTTFPQAIGVIISSQLVGRLYHRVGPRRLIFGGMASMSVFTLALAFVSLDTSLWWIRGIMFARGICMAFAFVPLQAATYANITPADTGRASALYSTQRQVSAALGVAALTTVLLTRAQSATNPAGLLSAYQAAFLTGGILVLCAAFSGLLIHDEDAASTIRREPAVDPALAAAGD